VKPKGKTPIRNFIEKDGGVGKQKQDQVFVLKPGIKQYSAQPKPITFDLPSVNQKAKERTFGDDLLDFFISPAGADEFDFAINTKQPSMHNLIAEQKKVVKDAEDYFAPWVNKSKEDEQRELVDRFSKTPGFRVNPNR